MLTLILMRHAKSDWSAGTDDHARPLNPRGRDACMRLGVWIGARGFAIDECLCSDAMRTQETAERVLGAADLDVTPTPVPELYLADAQRMGRILDGATGRCVLMVGHNPGIATFAHDLIAAEPDHPRFADYPTGASAVIRFDAREWPGVERGQLLEFEIPREL
ncbi:MAG: SixA phosphatase family protein [Paracoccaceae bacterium]